MNAIRAQLTPEDDGEDGFLDGVLNYRGGHLPRPELRANACATDLGRAMRKPAENMDKGFLIIGIR